MCIRDRWNLLWRDDDDFHNFRANLGVFPAVSTTEAAASFSVAKKVSTWEHRFVNWECPCLLETIYVQSLNDCLTSYNCVYTVDILLEQECIPTSEHDGTEVEEIHEETDEIVYQGGRGKINAIITKTSIM